MGETEQLAVAVKALEEISALPCTRSLREGAHAIVSVREAIGIADAALDALELPHERDSR